MRYLYLILELSDFIVPLGQHLIKLLLVGLHHLIGRMELGFRFSTNRFFFMKLEVGGVTGGDLKVGGVTCRRSHRGFKGGRS